MLLVAKAAPVLLALGGNLGDVAATFDEACACLDQWMGPIRRASLYQSRAMYMHDQPDFINSAALGWSDLAPFEILHRIKQLEQRLGRTAGPRFGPRIIDLDLVYYGDHILDIPDLVIPHPRRLERSFVLVPMAELAPDFQDPATGECLAALAERLAEPTSLSQLPDASMSEPAH